jgi:hypothetical protein
LLFVDPVRFRRDSARFVDLARALSRLLWIVDVAALNQERLCPEGERGFKAAAWSAPFGLSLTGRRLAEGRLTGFGRFPLWQAEDRLAYEALEDVALAVQARKGGVDGD